MTQTQSNPIPLVTVEEHHEAFYVWNYAVRKGWLTASGNTLLHADSHSDLALPRLRRPLDSIGDLADLAEFTYEELNIGNFIWPSVYLGLFSRVLWVRYRHKLTEGGWQSIMIGTKNHYKTDFFTASSLHATPYAAATDVRRIEYSPVTTQECIKTDQPVVVDIDLDYFCCNEYPQLPVLEVETTKAEYERFTHDPYHFLRIQCGKVSVIARDERYFFVYDDFPHRDDQELLCSPIDQSQVQERIIDFINYLRSYSILPPLIVICRSVFSGYTPRQHSSFVEESLTQQLGELYSLQTFSIQDLLPASTVERNHHLAA
ncbi:MAG: UPF0489 family protein [Candidatus Sulfotelmatobacter sp.]|jgi:uncharacterized protein UPF0489